MSKNKIAKFKLPTAYTVLLILMIVIALITQFVPAVKNIQLADLVMAPINGMIGVRDVELHQSVNDAMSSGGIYEALDILHQAEGPMIDVWNQGQLGGAIDVALFVIIVGGFLGVVAKTGALEAGIGALVTKLKGKEILLIPVLMFIFSLGGTTYGMAEETLAFYALITVTMIKAGFDPLVGTAIIMVGAGVGVLGSTINPFATGAAVSAAEAVGTTINQGTVIAIGTTLWLTTLGISIWYVMRYAKKVHHNRGNSLLSTAELEAADKAFAVDNEEIVVLTAKRAITLGIFIFSFLIMMMGVIPWNDFGITLFDNTAWLNGSPLGWWWFPELTIWFFLMAVAAGLIYRLSEKELVESFITGASEMVGVALIIGISRGISFMMVNSGLDLYILEQAATALEGVSGAVFANMSYIIYIGLTFLIPSTSGLASVSIPIFAPLAERLGIAPEIIIGSFLAGSGIVNIVTPTFGVVMGGLAISKVEYGSWLKFVSKLLVLLFIASIIVLTIVSFILG